MIAARADAAEPATGGVTIETAAQAGTEMPADTLAQEPVLPELSPAPTAHSDPVRVTRGRKRDSHLRRLLALADVLALAGSIALAV